MEKWGTPPGPLPLYLVTCQGPTENCDPSSPTFRRRQKPGQHRDLSGLQKQEPIIRRAVHLSRRFQPFEPAIDASGRDSFLLSNSDDRLVIRGPNVPRGVSRGMFRERGDDMSN